jgi:hypothetical protein
MRSPAKCAACVLPLLLSGCSIFHKSRPAPIQTLAPVIEPSMPLEVKSVELPPSQSVIAAQPIINMRERAVSIKQASKHHKPSNKPAEETEVATSPAPAVNAIGVLTSGDPANSRQQTEESIASIERGLNGINRPLNDSEQKTAGQIREFLKEAKTALGSGDTDGAHTLTEKAKALLAELTK